MTLYEIITEVLKDAYPDWIPSYSLEKAETPYGWIGTSGLRRCRELVTQGKIEDKRDGKYQYYRYKQTAPIQQAMAIPVLARERL